MMTPSSRISSRLSSPRRHRTAPSQILHCGIGAKPVSRPSSCFDPRQLDTLASDINRELDWLHFNDAFDIDKSYGPKNKFLFHCFLSGLSFKYRLTQNSTMYTAIEVGLDPHGVDTAVFHSQDGDVLVVGACIQLLLHGFVITTERAGPYYRRSAEEVAKNLKELKAEGIIREPHAVRVLELSISHAETGLNPENERHDVWDLLFPENS